MYVDLPVEDLRTGVRFPPAPPIIKPLIIKGFILSAPYKYISRMPLGINFDLFAHIID